MELESMQMSPSWSAMLGLGIDIGGSGIKGAVVDTQSGTLVSERVRIPTPQLADAASVTSIVREIVEQFGWSQGPVGIGFPGVIRHNVIHTAVNLHASLVGMNLESALKPLVGSMIRVLNDADAAGYAEMRFGEGRPYAASGTVLLLTVGTGIGTVLFSDGVLVPNLEMGHVEYRGIIAEHAVSERVRKEQDLSWKRWGRRFNGYLQYLEFLLQPDFIILGGGGVKRPEKFAEYLSLKTPWALAATGNRAGMIGAATAAAESAQG